jgi:hypothetical protein
VVHRFTGHQAFPSIVPLLCPTTPNESVVPEDDKPISEETRAKLVSAAEDGQRLAGEILNLAATARRLSPDDKPALNALEFVVLFQFELNSSLKAVAQSRSRLEAKFHARSLILIVFESLQTMRRLLAREFRQHVVTRVAEQGLEQRLKLVHSAVDKLSKDCNSRFEEVRNKLVAHRDVDPDVRLNLLQAVDTEEVARLTLEALRILTQFHREFLQFTRRMALANTAEDSQADT